MYLSLLEQAPLGIFKINITGEFIWVNLPFATLLGFRDKEDCLKALNSLEDRSVHYVNPEQRNHILSSVMEKNDWQTHDVKFYNKYKNVVRVKLKIRHVSDSEEENGYEGFVEEITDKKEILNALKQSEANFKNIFENFNDAIFVYDYEGKFLLVNNSACQMLGYEKHELMKLTTQVISKNYYNSEEKNEYNSFGTEELAQSDQLLFGSALISRKDEIIPVEANTQFIEYQNKKAILTTARDVRERKKEEKTIMQAIIETESRERRRFSEDLHNGLGPLLSSMKIYTSMMLNEQDINPEQYRLLSKQKNIIDQSIATTREVVNNLMPPVLQTHGFIAAIRTFATGIARANHLKINIDTGNYENQMNSNRKIIFYRIVNELINNTIKHSGAKNIDLFFGIKDDTFTFTYRDDGCGMDLKEAFYEKKKSLGLKNIYNKMKSINGKVRLSSAPGKGFSIKLEAPAETDI